MLTYPHPKPIIPVVLYHFNLSFGPRISSKMTSSHERRTKHRFNTVGANQDESGSSHPNVVSGRELRSRAAAFDIIEESEAGSSTDDDDIEDEPYRIEQRHGKAPAQEDNTEEEEAAGGDDEENE